LIHLPDRRHDRHLAHRLDDLRRMIFIPHPHPPLPAAIEKRFPRRQPVVKIAPARLAAIEVRPPDPSPQHLLRQIHHTHIRKRPRKALQLLLQALAIFLVRRFPIQRQKTRNHHLHRRPIQLPMPCLEIILKRPPHMLPPPEPGHRILELLHHPRQRPRPDQPLQPVNRLSLHLHHRP